MILVLCRRTFGSDRHRYAIIALGPDKLGTDPMAYGGLNEKNGRRRGNREESRK